MASLPELSSFHPNFFHNKGHGFHIRPLFMDFSRPYSFPIRQGRSYTGWRTQARKWKQKHGSEVQFEDYSRYETFRPEEQIINPESDWVGNKMVVEEASEPNGTSLLVNSSILRIKEEPSTPNGSIQLVDNRVEAFEDEDGGDIVELDANDEALDNSDWIKEDDSFSALPSITEYEEKHINDRFRTQNGREVFYERAYLVGVELKRGKRPLFGIQESLDELAKLAETAGLFVVGSMYQRLDHPSPRTYISSGKVQELQATIRAGNIETVILDDEISPGQLRNLAKAFGDEVRVCDRTALILDIFSQRAATREASLQVDLAKMEYQLPRLTRLWSHLERQAGGMVKGMGEKQIEVDKRILRSRITALKKELESVREYRQQYRNRRAAVPIPVVSLVGYTNAGKSTLLNTLSGAGVLAEDKLFATLDPITRRVELPNGKECLFTDTVGFIQKLPTQLVAAFRATLEEICDSSLIIHVVDISHPMAKKQIEAVESVLDDLDVGNIPMLQVWNKIDKANDPEALRAEAKQKGIVCLSALTGDGLQEFHQSIEVQMKNLLVFIEAVVPYENGDLINTIHRHGIVEHQEHTYFGTLIRAHVPLSFSKQLLSFRQLPNQQMELV